MWPHDLKCPTDIAHPRPVGVCDRCYEKRFLDDLVWQWDFRGNKLQNIRIRVCVDRCLDKPNEQLRPVIVGPDPIPPKDPRPYQYAAQNAGGTAPLPITTVTSPWSAPFNGQFGPQTITDEF